MVAPKYTGGSDELKHVHDRGLVKGSGRGLNIEHEPPTETFTDDFINLHIILSNSVRII